MAKKAGTKRGAVEPTDDAVQISDLILTLREAIDIAAEKRQAANLPPLLYVDEANVQVQVQIVKEKTAKGGVKIYVADLGAEGKEQSGKTHTLSLTLKATPEEAQKPERMAGTARHKRG